MTDTPNEFAALANIMTELSADMENEDNLERLKYYFWENIPTILRALRIAEVAGEVEAALDELIKRAAHDTKNNQEDEIGGGWWSPMTVKATEDAKSALANLRKAREASQ
jgi:hypothetical protein